MATCQGFEPQFAGSRPAVLPLDEHVISTLKENRTPLSALRTQCPADRRQGLGYLMRIELTFSPSQGDALPIYYRYHLFLCCLSPQGGPRCVYTVRLTRGGNFAEIQGFEPWVRSHVLLFSKQVHSASLPNFHPGLTSFAVRRNIIPHVCGICGRVGNRTLVFSVQARYSTTKLTAHVSRCLRWFSWDHCSFS